MLKKGKKHDFMIAIRLGQIYKSYDFRSRVTFVSWDIRVLYCEHCRHSELFQPRLYRLRVQTGVQYEYFPTHSFLRLGLHPRNIEDSFPRLKFSEAEVFRDILFSETEVFRGRSFQKQKFSETEVFRDRSFQQQKFSETDVFRDWIFWDWSFQRQKFSETEVFRDWSFQRQKFSEAEVFRDRSFQKQKFSETEVF